MLDFLFGEKVVKTTTIKEKTIQTSKRMYSEEDIIDLIQFLSMNKEFNEYSSVSKETARYFLEQFKKK